MFNLPSARLRLEATDAWLAHHYLKLLVSLRFTLVGQLLSPVGGVGPDFLEAWGEVLQSGQEMTCARVSCRSAGVT
jgi:hypothetical protein